MLISAQDNFSTNKISEIFQTLKPEKEWSFEGCTQSQTGKWTHGYHRYPAKFIPQLAEKLMGEYITGSKAHINDPFMGSGTTIASAISKGFKASGTDVNGIAYLMTKVKASPIDPQYLDKKLGQFLAKLTHIHNQQTSFFTNGNTPIIPTQHLERIDYWFHENNKIALGRILAVIHNEEDESIRDFLRVGFSHILKSCSIWLQGSTKPTRDLKKSPSDPYTTLRRHLKKMQRGNDVFYEIVPHDVKNQLQNYLNVRLDDARHQPVTEESVDLIVSSSPYVTSYEYADLHQLSTIWLELASDLSQYRQDFIGTSHKNYADKILKGEFANQIVSEMETKDRKMAREIAAYFIDMQEVFDESYRILKHGGRCCYVIGNTKLKKVAILNAEAFTEGLLHSGFSLERIIVREIPLKILPQKRDEKTGRFASNEDADSQAYPIEYIVIGVKE